MFRALTAQQSQAIEARAVSEMGISLGELMDRAGAELASVAADASSGGRIVIAAGPGNNGGDGWVAARLLHAAGHDVAVASVVAPDALLEEAATASAAAIDAGVCWSAGELALAEQIDGAETIIDALLGTGARLPLREPLAIWCALINKSDALVVSADLPTGVDTDSGAAVTEAVRADVTVAFSSLKRAHVVFPAAALAGEVVVADIGIPAAFADDFSALEVWDADEYAALLPRPTPDAHKNTRGRLLIVAGSQRYIGAAVLAARGAMRAGAGYVTLAVPEPVVSVAQHHLVAAPVVGLPAGRSRSFAASAAERALELAADYDAVVLGPGLTLADGAVMTARTLVSNLRRPLVVDADALNALVDAVSLLDARTAETVITPHPGELGRLLGIDHATVQADRVSSSARLAAGNRSVVLKGAGTVVSGHGRQVIETWGTPALATAGTGDVLAGVIGTLLAQGLDSFAAGALGTHLHARAGRLAAADLTPICVTAEDVPDYLPGAVAELLGTW